MKSFNGFVDWRAVESSSRTEPWAVALDASSGERRFTRGGVELLVGRADVLVHHEPGRITLVRGGPRLTDAVGSGDALPMLHEAFVKQGAEATSRLSGRYSIVHVDAIAQRLFLVVDRFAVHPLCFAEGSGSLGFSDRADNVPTMAPRDIDHQAIFDYLYFHVIPAPRTVFSGVNRLDLAECLQATPRAVRVVRHWTPVFAATVEQSSEALEAQFRDIVADAVRKDAASGRVAAFLSGGTDSSTVSGMLGRITGAPAKTYSIGFEAEGYDEMEYARIAARHFGTEHHEHYVTPADLVAAIPQVALHYDQPFGNSSAVPAYLCAAAARADGNDTLLAGDGGDELFGGNTRYAKQKVFAAYDSVPPAVRATLLEPMFLGTPIGRLPGLRKAASYVRQARVPMPDRANSYNLLLRLGLSEVLEPQFLERVQPQNPADQEREVYSRSHAAHLVDRMLAFDWKYTLADNDLPKVCGTTDLAGIRVAFPLLSDELTDFSLSLGPGLKVRGLKLRYFFKQALKGFLPDEILTKKKHGFGLPFGVWAARDPALRRVAADALESLAQRGIVRRAFTTDLITVRLLEHPGYYGEMVWILMMLEHWLAGVKMSDPHDRRRRVSDSLLVS